VNICAKLLPKAIIEKLDWIVQRTNFIDKQLDAFLQDTVGSASASSRRQVLVLGLGYDTRCLRYGKQPFLDFYCVDLPSVASNSQKIIDWYMSEIPNHSSEPKKPIFIYFDLNDVFTNKSESILQVASKKGFVTDGSIPTMVICEAVLFYLIPDAARKITTELFQLSSSSSSSRFCFTDNLSKVGVMPGGGSGGPPQVVVRTRCESWLKGNNKELIDHDSIWGGAIHFVGAKERIGMEDASSASC